MYNADYADANKQKLKEALEILNRTMSKKGTNMSGEVTLSGKELHDVLAVEFPTIVGVTVYEQREKGATTFRINNNGIFFDAVVPDTLLRSFKSQDEFNQHIVDKTKAFFGIPVKKKRATVSKKQRELKKAWLLK